MKNNPLPIIREKKSHVLPETIEEFLANTTESKSTVEIILKTYENTILTNISMYIEQLNNNELNTLKEVQCIRNIILNYVINLLDALELLSIASKQLQTINENIDSRFSQCS